MVFGPVRTRIGPVTDVMTEYLEKEGVNLWAVIDLDSLTVDLRNRIASCCREMDSYSQLLLCGHGGKNFWQHLSESDLASPNPIDTRSVQVITACLEECSPGSDYEIIYPGMSPLPLSLSLPLQDLGRLSGWHHDSPLGLGIHPVYGLWFAYRSVVLSNTKFTPTVPLKGPSPCLSCKGKDCLAACPAGALSDTGFDVNKCVSHRLTEQSDCASKCIARNACPVAAEHRYGNDQLNYHYSQSLTSIRRFSN